MFGWLLKRKKKALQPNDVVVTISGWNYKSREAYHRSLDTGFSSSERRDFKKSVKIFEKEDRIFLKKLPSVLKEINPAVTKNQIKDLIKALEDREGGKVVFLAPAFDRRPHFHQRVFRGSSCSCYSGAVGGCCGPLDLGINGIPVVRSLPPSLTTGFWWGVGSISHYQDEWSEEDHKWAEKEGIFQKERVFEKEEDEPEEHDDEW